MQTRVFCEAACYLNVYICAFGYFSYSLSPSVCVCVCQERGVKECIHGHEVVCVSTADDLREAELSHGAFFCFVMTLLFLMDKQGHHLNTISPACLTLSLYSGPLVGFLCVRGPRSDAGLDLLPTREGAHVTWHYLAASPFYWGLKPCRGQSRKSIVSTQTVASEDFWGHCSWRVLGWNSPVMYLNCRLHVEMDEASQPPPFVRKWR